MDVYDLNLDGPLPLLQDASNQLLQFNYLPTIELINEYIKNADLKTLEEYTGKESDFFDSIWPGTCQKYNALVDELKKGIKSDEHRKDFFSRIFPITHPTTH